MIQWHQTKTEVYRMEQEKLKRLEAFEAMYSAVDTEYKDIVKKMEMLKGDGRVNSATYRQLMGRKLSYQNMLEMYKIYDL